MKILLAMPHPNAKYSFFSRFVYPSLTLKQLAALTPSEHDIELVDERCEPIDFSKDYDLVALSSLTYNAPRGYEVAQKFKEKGSTVVYGGYHASLLPDEVKQHVDSVVIGEAELSWPRLLEDLQRGTLQPFYRAERFVNPEEIPAARHDIGSYNPFSEAIQASRGCPTGCEFCAMQVVEGNRFRGRPVDHLIDEMKTIKTRTLFFTDASLTINPAYSKALFRAMKELNKHAECFGNINVLARDDEFLNLAHDAGIFNWYVGVESISQENINAAGKGTNKVENYSKAIRKIKDHGMMITGFFMFGFDGDTQETFDKTLQAIYDWDLDDVSFSIITPYPGTRLFQRYEKEGRIISYDWSRYTEGYVNYKPKNLSEAELKAGIERMGLDFHSYPRLVQRAFSNIHYSPFRMIIKLPRNLIGRWFFLHEKK